MVSDKRAVVLKVSEVAKILNLPRPKVYVLIQAGSLRAVKIGNDWRVIKSSVGEMIGVES